MCNVILLCLPVILFRSPKIEKALRELDEHGVAVIPEVLTEDECDEQVTLVHQWLAKFHPNHPSSINSIVHKYRIGHCETVWACRMKAKPVFSEIFGTDKLLTSFDGMAIGQPPELGDARFKFAQDPNSFDGLHLDQGPQRKGLHAYQGAVYLEEAEFEDYCFKVIRDSHKHHEDFFQNFHPGPKSEFRKLTKKEVQWYLQRGCKVQRVAVPKGGIVLWDSRTAHAGAPPVINRKNARWRYVSFICMAPAKWAQYKDYVVKKQGYEEMRTSCHWPANGAHLFRRYGVHPGQDIEEMPAIAKTEEAKKMVGVIPYETSADDLPTWTPEYNDEYDYLPY